MTKHINPRADTSKMTAQERVADRNTKRRKMYAHKTLPSRLERYEQHKEEEDAEVELVLQARLDADDRKLVVETAMDKVVVKLDTPVYSRRLARKMDGDAEVLAEKVSRKRRAEVPATPPKLASATASVVATTASGKRAKGSGKAKQERQHDPTDLHDHVESPPAPAALALIALPPASNAFEQLSQSMSGQPSILNMDVS